MAPVPDLAMLVALVDRLQVENRQLAEAAATWPTRALMLEEQLALTALSQQPLEAPRGLEPAPPVPRRPGGAGECGHAAVDRDDAQPHAGARAGRGRHAAVPVVALARDSLSIMVSIVRLPALCL